jgi:hypothetical protein
MLGVANFKSRLGWSGLFFFLRSGIPAATEPPGHAEENLGIFLAQQATLRDMQRWLRPYSLPTTTEAVLLSAMLGAVPGREGGAFRQL